MTRWADHKPTESHNIDMGRFISYYLPGGLVAIWIITKLAFPEFYLRVIQEDGILENLQALLYFLTSIICIVIGIRFIRSETL